MFSTDEGGHAIGKHSLAKLILAMPAPDRIAMVRELLEGTGRVVARDVAHLDGVGEFMVADNERMRQAMVWARMAGWNACRAAMLGDGDA